MTTYNGWRNRQTWNVALWISNEEPLYRAAVSFMQRYTGPAPYAHFVMAEGLAGTCTPDGIKWNGTKLGYGELNRFMRELAD